MWNFRPMSGLLKYVVIRTRMPFTVEAGVSDLQSFTDFRAAIVVNFPTINSYDHNIIIGVAMIEV